MSTQAGGIRMRVIWVGTLLTALTVGETLAQSVSKSMPVGAECMELHRAVMTQIANGRLNEAERAVSAALAASDGRTQNPCAALVLNNVAVFMSVSGRSADAERLAERAIGILEKTYSPNDLVLLRPLQTLAVVRIEQGKTAKAREAFKRMQAIRIERPEDRALVHGIAGILSETEGKLPEAEIEYLASLQEWEHAGRGETADAGAIFNDLGVLYIHEQRLTEAQQALDRALAISSRAKDATPIDRIKVLHCRGALHARQGEWREAEQDFRDALSIADQEPWVEPVALRSLLTSYAYVLRKNHHRREARTIEARAAGIRVDATSNIIDVADLLAKPAHAKE
jgi:tetratricopeptide (TPR) repeat protein